MAKMRTSKQKAALRKAQLASARKRRGKGKGKSKSVSKARGRKLTRGQKAVMAFGVASLGAQVGMHTYRAKTARRRGFIAVGPYYREVARENISRRAATRNAANAWRRDWNMRQAGVGTTRVRSTRGPSRPLNMPALPSGMKALPVGRSSRRRK